MHSELTTFEIAILNEIAAYNQKRLPLVKEHIPCLKVKSREYTGVGMYVHFEYTGFASHIISPLRDVCVSSSKNILLDNTKHPLSYELNITKGKIDFLEVIANGEDWDGTFNTFELTD